MLKLDNLLAQRRLCHGQSVRRLSEMALLGDGDEIPEVTQIDSVHRLIVAEFDRGRLSIVRNKVLDTGAFFEKDEA